MAGQREQSKIQEKEDKVLLGNNSQLEETPGHGAGGVRDTEAVSYNTPPSPPKHPTT